MRRAIKVLIGLVLGALFLWLALRGVDGPALAQVWRGADVGVLALAPVCLAMGYVCRVWRWHRMLVAHNPGLPVTRTGVAFVGSIAVNNLVPLRMGDAMRCFAFSHWLGLAPGAVVGGVLVERVLDLLAVVLAMALALWVFGVTGGPVGGVALWLVGLGAAVLVLRPDWLALPLTALAALVGHWVPGLAARATGFALALRAAMADLGQPRRRLVLILWTLPVWVFEGATYWVVAQALPALPAPGAAWLAMPAGTLATLVPSTPGHLGPFDFAAQWAATVMGNPLAEATAFVLLIHAVLWLTTTATGGLCLIWWATTGRGRAA